MDIGCTPFFVHEFMYLGQHFREVGDDWKIFDCGWKIGWKIFRSQIYLPAFIVLKVRELRRFWEIWQIFSRAEL
ncbi:hypothetical protein [Leyella stercorea]|uniref:hypothetical protein n=1 Tax=Leyella stercorea TaxID=363265 RepID=UPI003A936AFE